MSKNNDFFKPTLLYKEFMILDLIEKNVHVTQREMAASIGVAVSMINGYLNKFDKLGLIDIEKFTSKDVKYNITKKGSERKKLLNVGYLNSAQKLHNSAKENIDEFLNEIEKRGFKKIMLYGAGEVAELFLGTIQLQNVLDLEVLAVIDDDQAKQGTLILNYLIVSIDRLRNFSYDGILISSYTNQKKNGRYIK